eukprot:3478786-Rhodomonas_salina.1
MARQDALQRLCSGSQVTLQTASRARSRQARLFEQGTPVHRPRTEPPGVVMVLHVRDVQRGSPGLKLDETDPSRFGHVCRQGFKEWDPRPPPRRQGQGIVGVAAGNVNRHGQSRPVHHVHLVRRGVPVHECRPRHLHLVPWEAHIRVGEVGMDAFSDLHQDLRHGPASLQERWDPVQQVRTHNSEESQAVVLQDTKEARLILPFTKHDHSVPFQPQKSVVVKYQLDLERGLGRARSRRQGFDHNRCDLELAVAAELVLEALPQLGNGEGFLRAE